MLNGTMRVEAHWKEKEDDRCAVSEFKCDPPERLDNLKKRAPFRDAMDKLVRELIRKEIPRRVVEIRITNYSVDAGDYLPIAVGFSWNTCFRNRYNSIIIDEFVASERYQHLTESETL